MACGRRLTLEQRPLKAEPRQPRFGSATVAYFTEAYCHELALAIHDLTGWELWACVGTGHFEACGVHALVRLPDGRYLDVRGVQSGAEARSYWERAVLRRVSSSYFAEWSDVFGPPRRARVQRVAERLVELVAA